MRPSPLTVRVVLGVFLLSILAALGPSFLILWQLVLGLVGSLVLFDALRLLSATVPEISRRVDSALPLGVWRKAYLTLKNPSKRPMNVRVIDHYPHGVAVRKEALDLQVPPGTEAEQYYEIKAVHRGTHVFEAAHVLLHSPFGFWRKRVRTGETTQVRVYPNFQAVARYMMLDVNQRLAQIGIHRRRRRGEGREFHQLREFVEGDSMRQIDWKASSRMRKIISREFRDERDQQVLFLMDCGQSMRAKDGELSHFDHALNAVLLMGSVALRHGDAVGLITFGGERRMLSPRKGTSQLNLILNNVFDIQPSLQTSDFASVAEQVLTHCRKRTLLVLVTNIKDEDDGELAPALRMLRRKHLVLVASMREKVLQEALEQPVTQFDDALQVGAVHTYLKRRRQLNESMRAKGVLSLDVEPDKLPVSMVNSYLDIKAQGLL